MRPHPLHNLFAPKHIAVIGASDRSNSVGQRLLTNLLASSFNGKITPVNIRHKIVGGLTAYASVTQIPDPVDVAIVLTRIDSLETIFKECHKRGIRFVILVKTLENVHAQDRATLKKAVAKAKKLGVRVLGPSLLGLIRSNIGLNASIYTGQIHPGNLAVVSQSSALCTAMLDWAYSRDIGFSTVLSLGEKTWDVDFGEILDYLVNDRATHAILLHINQVSHGRQFMSALRAAARVKPVLVIKSGHDEDRVTGFTQASRALNSDDVFTSALARAGVLQVKSISQMFVAVKILAANYRSAGERLAIVCNGIGLGILAADTAHDEDVPLAKLSKTTMEALNAALPENWSHANPVDIIGDAGPLRFRTAVKLCLDDDNVDGVLVLFSPQIGTDHLATAQMMVQLQSETNKPLLLSWLGDSKVQESRALFARSRRVHFNAPDQAIEVFKKLGAYHRNQKLLLQTPGPLTDNNLEPDFDTAHKLLSILKLSGERIIPENVSKQVLGLFGIHTNRTQLAQSEEAACEMANRMGYPVVLKIDSPDLFYKSDIDGVRLNIGSEAQVRETYRQILDTAGQIRPPIRINGITVQPMFKQKHARELSISVTRDPIFGPVITLGAGGWAGNLQQQRAVALPPLNEMLVNDMIERTAISHTLGQFKNMPPVDFIALRHALLRISEMVCELPEIEELEIDPFIVSPDGVMALDARIVLHEGKDTVPRRYGHMAIMPYPHFLETEATLKDGSQVFVRPMRPEDAEMLQTFVTNMSDESRYNRFMSSIKQLSQTMLVRFTQLDYDREMALVMIKPHIGQEDEILAVSRYTTDPDMEVCEFAISVSDQWQGHGIGYIMMNLLFDAARHQGLKIMRGEILTANAGMQKLTRKLGFSVRKDPEDGSICLVEKPLLKSAETTNPTKTQ